MGVAFLTVMAVEVSNVVVFFCFVNVCKANSAKIEAAGMSPIEWTIAMGVEKNPRHREEKMIIMMDYDYGRRKRRPSWSQC